MLTFTSLLPILLLSTACVTETDNDLDEDTGVSDGKGDSPTTTPRRLVASTNANEIRLARVENVIGTGLRAIAIWERDTELNGRDLWLTLRPRDAEAMVWKTPENIVSVDSLQFSSNALFIGKENRTVAEGFVPVVPFSLEVRLDQQSGLVSPTIHLHKDSGAMQRDYDLAPTRDALSTFLGQIDQLDRVESADYLVRLVMIDPSLSQRAPNQKKLFLILTDRETNKVFPLGFNVNSATYLAFSSPREVTFDAREQQPTGEELTSTYAVSWEQSTPTIRRVP